VSWVTPPARITLLVASGNVHENGGAPIDSRLAKWLKTFGFPMDVSAAGLADPGCYAVVSDGFRALCEAADVPPCVMDAAILVSFDCEWSEDETIF